MKMTPKTEKMALLAAKYQLAWFYKMMRRKAAKGEKS